MFIAAQFTAAKKWKQSKCLPTDFLYLNKESVVQRGNKYTGNNVDGTGGHYVKGIIPSTERQDHMILLKCRNLKPLVS